MAELRAPVTRLPAPVPPTRPEYIRDVIAGGDIGVVQKPLTVFQRLANQGWLRKAVILIVIAVAWEAYAQRLNNPLLVPTFSATIEAFWGGIVSGDIPQKMSNSVQLLLKGYALGLALAMTLTALAIMSRIGTDLLETLTSAFNPLPGIALLPLALIWFGLGWYIYENKNMLDIPAVFAGLFTVILIGLVVENLIFRNIETATVRRWGMQS